MQDGSQEKNGTEDAVKVRLKWFNHPKGFGFVVPEHEAIDAFLHITTLQRAGIQKIEDGACLLCLIDRGQKGAQVREVLTILDSGAVVATPATDAHRSGPAPRLVRMEGTVKWYKPEREFGFITPDDGEKDVFLHKSCLEQQGLSGLEPGMRLSMLVKIVAKGREVVEFSVI